MIPVLPAPDDVTLLRAVARRSEAAFGELYDGLLRPVYSMIVCLVQSPAKAEEVLQEAFWQIWERAPGYRRKRGSVMLLVEIAPGGRFPEPQHDSGGDEGSVLSGEGLAAGRLRRAGDDCHAAEGTAHTGAVRPSGCTALDSLTATTGKKGRPPFGVQ